MTTLQSFRFKVTMCNVEGTTVPVQDLPPHVKTWVQHYLSEVSLWNDWLFGELSTTYAAVLSVGLQTYSDAFESRLITDCPVGDRARLIRDIERVSHSRSFDGYYLQGITVVVPEWGGEPPPGGEPLHEPLEDLEVLHELWAGQGPIAVEHLAEDASGRRFKARAVWRNRRLYWQDRQFTYVFSDFPTWIEAHLEKLADFGITARSVRVIRKNY